MANVDYLALLKQYGPKETDWISGGSQYLTSPGPYGTYGKRTGTPDFAEETWAGLTGALSSAYGYSPEISAAILRTLGSNPPTGSDTGSSQPFSTAGYGSYYDIGKYFGGAESLASYLLGGGKTVAGVSEAADYNAYRGGSPIMMKADGTQAYREGQMSPSDAAESFYSQGIEPTQQQIAGLVGQPPTPQSSLASLIGGGTPTSSQTSPQQSLVDIYTSRPDLQAEAKRLFPGQNPTVGGSAANTWLNDWWNKYGVSEYAGNTLGGSAGAVAGAGGATGGGGAGGTAGGATGGAISGATGGGTTGNTYMDFANQVIESWKQKQTGIQGLETQIQGVEELLNNLEKDIDTRISENSATGGVITTAHKNRYLAAEGSPLREQLAQLSHAQAGLESGAASDLQYYDRMINASQYQSPQDKLAAQIAEEQAMKNAGLGSYAPKETESWSEPYLLGGDYVQKNTKTGEIRTVVNPTGGGNNTPTEDSIVSYLQNQGIPVQVATAKGELTTGSRNKILNAGVPLDILDFIWANMVAGNDFETIRKGMRGEGISTDWLDKFVQAIQPKTTNSSSEQPDN